MEAARKVGELIAERAGEKGLKQVVFDRGGYLYHGRVRPWRKGPGKEVSNFETKEE